MLDADDAKAAAPGSLDAWHTWQRSAVAYWLHLHRGDRRYLRDKGLAVPTVQRMRDLATQINRIVEGIPRDWRIQPASNERADALARVGWWHELVAALYQPVEAARETLRDQPTEEAIETLVRFLEADPYCHRSGYEKADVIRSLTQVELSEEIRARLQRVLLTAVHGPTRREFRVYIRLARAVDDDELRIALSDALASRDRHIARHARWVLDGLPERQASRRCAR